MKSELSTGWGIVAVVAVVPSILWQLWVMARLWLWFAVPLGLPALGMAHIWGFLILLGMLKPHPDVETKTTNCKVVRAVILAVLRPAFALLVGMLTRHFMLA